MTDIDEVYGERDALVAALSKLFPAHLCIHEGEDQDDEWRNIVCIHLPAGQVTWHVRKTELPWFSHLKHEKGHYDGHSTPVKYARLALLQPK